MTQSPNHDALQTGGSARHDGIRRDAEEHQLNAAARIRDNEARQRDAVARQRDSEARQRDAEAFRRRWAEAQPQKASGEGGLSEEDGHQREDAREDDGLAREDEGRVREDESRVREDDGRQRDDDGRQCEEDSHKREDEARHRYGHASGPCEDEARQRDGDGVHERENAGRLREDEAHQREDEGRQREREGRRREDEGRQREDEGLQREIALKDRIRWTEIFQNVGYGVGIVDARSDRVYFANEALAGMHGSGLEGLHGLPAISLYAPAERERVRIFYDTADRTGQVVFEADRLRKDGSVFPSEVHISSVSGENSDVLYRIVTVRDITSRRQMQAELDESRRFEAIGQLTAGVAHDFNNLLQGIISNLELIDDDVGVAPATRECVAFAVRLAERGGEVAHRLLSFSRKQLLVPKALDLDEFLLAFRELLSHTLNPRIRITLEIARGLAPVWIDPAHLQTTLLNLAINARDAMPSGGNLTIEALGTPDVVAVRADSASLDRFAIIRISDTGTGIAADILAKVCEPFFSTKGLNGTGLGLSMAEGFLKQSGGDLRITSKLGKGTCVALWLPLAPTVATVAGAPC